MEYEIGKITVFDGHCGKIVSENGEYLFLDTDIMEGNELKVGDLVTFRGEVVHNHKKAYFVKIPEQLLLDKAKQKIIESN